MAVKVEREVLPVDRVLDAPENLDMARDRDGSLVIEPELFLGLFEQLPEERVIDVGDGDHKPLMLLSSSDHDCHAPSGDVLQLLLVVVVVVVKVQQVEEVEVRVAPVGSHRFTAKAEAERLYTYPAATAPRETEKEGPFELE